MRTALLLSLTIGCVLATTATGDEKRSISDFRKQRGAIEKRLVSPDVADRVAALGDLKDYPHLDALKLALPFWQKDPSSDVRSAAADTLMAFNDEATVRPAIFDMVKRDVTDTNGVLVAVWLAGASAEEQSELLEPLGKLIDRRPIALQPLFAVADYLGTRHRADAVAALWAFTKLPAFKTNFGFRRAVVGGLTSVRHVDAVTKLIEMLPESDGETRGDVIQHLVKISGQAHGPDVGAWQTWWTTKQASFEFPAPPVGQMFMLKEGQPAYYGIPIYAKKVIFVIDTSGSMKGKRIIDARAELVKAVNTLPSVTSFNMAAYNSTLTQWHRKLLEAGPDVKLKATKWVNQQQAAGATHTYDALKAALDQKPEAIYFLSDGEPTGGTIVAPPDILNAIKQTNRYQRTTIHVIGVNPGPDDGVFSKFLKTLAAQNYGQYRRVD